VPAHRALGRDGGQEGVLRPLEHDQETVALILEFMPPAGSECFPQELPVLIKELTRTGVPNFLE
jgi:hypothetical protein